jgi:hypothetical protein
MHSAAPDVVEIRTATDLERVLQAREGYVYNMYPSLDPAMCPVHQATCRHTARMLVAGGDTLAIPKLWATDLGVLLDEIVSRRRSYRLCGAEPRLGDIGVRTSVDQRTTAADEVPEPAAITAAPRDRASPPETKPPADGAWYHLTRDDAGVEYWSSHRLAFDPRDWRAGAQRELATAVRELPVGRDEILAAVFASQDRSLADAENVLLYNLWPFGLSRVPGKGVRFERSFSVPNVLEAIPASAIYGNRYSPAGTATSFAIWQPSSVVLSFDDVALPSRMPSRCSPIWWAVKNSISLLAGPPVRRLQAFGVALTLTLPRLPRGIPPPWVKVLFGGAIAAAAFDDTASVRPDLAEIAEQVGGQLEVVRHHLSDESSAPLGGLHMARRGGGGLQLSPPDDYCVAGQLLLQEDNVSAPRLSGRIFEVKSVE